MNSSIGSTSIFILHENNHVTHVATKAEEELGSTTNWVYRPCAANVTWPNFSLKNCILWEYPKHQMMAKLEAPGIKK